VVGGPRVRMDDMLPVWPSAYPSAMTYDFFTYAGAPGAYNLALGAGAGVYWQGENGFSVSTSYLSTNGNSSCPNNDAATQQFIADINEDAVVTDERLVGPCYDDGEFVGGGIGTDAAGSSATTQIAYASDNWGIAAAYTYASGDNGVGLYQGNATPGGVAASLSDSTNSFGVSTWWMPEESGWIPSISAGYGGTWVEVVDNDVYTNSWYVGLEWDDVFLEGNSLGAAIGQPTWIASSDDGDLNEEAGFAYELFYKFQVTDNISVTPAITYLSKPFPAQDSDGLSAFSGLIKTQFKF
jgi:hypothetical protein